MLKLPHRPLSDETVAVLAELQAEVDRGETFGARATLAKARWSAKTSKTKHALAFTEIRQRLSEMAYGSVRCAYCEDSAADEIEHIAAKTVIPSRAFDWMNYCYACGPCNGPKGNEHATVDLAGTLSRTDPNWLSAEPVAISALLDPRVDDATAYLEIDIGGVTPTGDQLPPTLEFRIVRGLDSIAAARAEYTREVLRLNREVVRKARESALIAYRACLTEYAEDKRAGVSTDELARRRTAILEMPHPSVLSELIRQAATQPKVQRAMAIAPEIRDWLR